MVVDAVRQGGRAGGFRLDEGRTAGINVSIFVGHSAEKPAVQGETDRGRKKEKESESNTVVKRGKNKEKVKQNREGEREEGTEKKTNRRLRMLKTLPFESAAIIHASQHLLLYKKVVSTRA